MLERGFKVYEQENLGDREGKPGWLDKAAKTSQGCFQGGHRVYPRQ
jgi:hypothetical protein